MLLFHLFAQADELEPTVNALAHLNYAHLIDLNPGKLPHELKNAKQITLIDETQRKLE